MKQVPAFETHNIVVTTHDLFLRIILRSLAVDHQKQALRYRYEKHSDEERDDVTENDERPCESEFFLREAVADVNDVKDDEDDGHDQ